MRWSILLLATQSWCCALAATYHRLRRGAVAARSLSIEKHNSSLKAVRPCNHGGNGTRRQLMMMQDIPAALGAMGNVIADGYSRVGCDVDITPKDHRVYFKDAACGPELKSCRLQELGMTPRLCFDFCRQFENAKFFALVGADCYCTPYFHTKTMGGEGDCNFVCEGDEKEMCGGRSKSSWFEMHMCKDSVSEAETAMKKGNDVVTACIEAEEATEDFVTKLRGLSGSWNLGICSVPKYGEMACSLPSFWRSQAAELEKTGHELTHLSMTLNDMVVKLKEAKATMDKAEGNVNSSLASAVESQTRNVMDLSAKATGAAAMLATVEATVEGPFGKPPVGNLSTWKSVFTPFGDVDKGWNAFCLLTPIPHKSFAAVTSAEKASSVCAAACLALSSGCAAFNYQYKDGLAACQLLTGEGLVEPSDSLSKAVPIFEVSASKMGFMGVADMGCYGQGAFTSGIKVGSVGALETKVIGKSTVDSKSKL